MWDGDVLAHESVAADASGDPVVEERTYLFEDDSFEPAAGTPSRAAGCTTSTTQSAPRSGC